MISSELIKVSKGMNYFSGFKTPRITVKHKKTLQETGLC